LTENIGESLSVASYAIGGVTMFTVLNSFRLNSWSSGRPLVAFMGIINTFLGIGAGWGLLMYIGYPWQAINIGIYK
jgi:hypothetical protein